VAHQRARAEGVAVASPAARASFGRGRGDVGTRRAQWQEVEEDRLGFVVLRLDGCYLDYVGYGFIRKKSF
jgi:hypothetical protein